MEAGNEVETGETLLSGLFFYDPGLSGQGATMNSSLSPSTSITNREHASQNCLPIGCFDGRIFSNEVLCLELNLVWEKLK